MPSSSPKPGVSRNRSLALDDVFKADRDGEGSDHEEGSRFGTTSTIHHLHRSHRRSKDDMSEAGNQSVSTIGGSRGTRRNNGVRKDSKSSGGRVVVKRTISRRVDHTQSFSATSGLIELLSPTKPAPREKLLKISSCQHEEEGIAASGDDNPIATERRRRIPSRAKSSDAVLDHKAHMEKKGESNRRTTTSRRNFSHTGGGGRIPKKEDSLLQSGDDQEAQMETPVKKTHRRHHSRQIEDAKDEKRIEHSQEKDLAQKTTSHQSSSRSSRQQSDSRTEREKDRIRPSYDAHTKHSTSSRSSSRAPSRTTSKTEVKASPKRVKKNNSGTHDRSERSSSDAKKSSRHGHQHDSTKLRSQSSRESEKSESCNRSVHVLVRKPSITDKDDIDHIKHDSPGVLDKEDYGYGPGSPGRSPKKSADRFLRDYESDGSSSIDRYEADPSHSDAEDTHESDDDNSSDSDGYTNPYTSSCRKGKYYDDDEDTVLQFDPTQHDGLQEVKRAGSMHYEFENADGTSVVGQITELADPVGEMQMLAAQEENQRRKESLFDFLATDEGEGEQENAYIKPNGQDCEMPGDADSSDRKSEDGFGPPTHFEMDMELDQGDGPANSGGRWHDERQESWAKTEDDDPLSPTQDEAKRKKTVLKKVSRRSTDRNEAGKARGKDNQKKSRSSERTPRSTSAVRSALSPAKVIAKVKSITLEDGTEAENGGDGDLKQTEDLAVNDSPKHVAAPAANHIPESPRTSNESPKKAVKKKGKGLGGIGRYFGRSKRHEEDDDMMSVGSTSIGFFNPVRAKHQLLGDDSSVESGLS